MNIHHRQMFSLTLLISLFVLIGLRRPSDLFADTLYDCNVKENREKPTTVEMTLSKKWKGQIEPVRRALTSGLDPVKARIRFFPFLEPPKNIGIGKCVTAESARIAIREAIRYNGGVDRLIIQEMMPHHWIKIGATDLSELTWIPVEPDALARLADPALSTEQFHEIYRRLARQTEKKLPFGMGSEKLDERP